MRPVREADRISKLPLDELESSHDARKRRQPQIKRSESNMAAGPLISIKSDIEERSDEIHS
jgi:hypothetical protein